MRLHPNLLAPLLLLAAASCGGSADPGSSVDSGYQALNSSDPGSALTEFEAALAGMEATNDRYVEAKLGQLRALAYNDPVKAKDGFIAFATEKKLPAGDFTMQVGDLQKAAVSRAAGGSDEDEAAAQQTIAYAAELLAAGKAAHPENDKWDALIKQVGDKAKTLGATDALSMLRGLGYVGGD